MKRFLILNPVCAFAVAAFVIASPVSAASDAAARGPLRVHPENPRYFTDGSGTAIYLTGSHTWNSLADMGRAEPPEAFDFDGYLARSRRAVPAWRKATAL